MSSIDGALGHHLPNIKIYGDLKVAVTDCGAEMREIQLLATENLLLIIPPPLDLPRDAKLTRSETELYKGCVDSF